MDFLSGVLERTAGQQLSCGCYVPVEPLNTGPPDPDREAGGVRCAQLPSPGSWQAVGRRTLASYSQQISSVRYSVTDPSHRAVRQSPGTYLL